MHTTTATGDLTPCSGEAGAPGDPPEGNCVDKVTRWLKIVSDDLAIDDLAILGKVLEEYMEVDNSFESVPGFQEKGRERIREICGRNTASHTTKVEQSLVSPSVFPHDLSKQF